MSRPPMTGPVRNPAVAHETAMPFAGPSAPAVVTEPQMVPPPKKKPHWFLAGVEYFRRKRSGVRPMAVAVAVAVQGEWALGRVTVVRNDLSDSDLEVVPTSPVRPAPVRPARTEPVESVDRQPARGGGGRRWMSWVMPAGRARA